MGTTARRASASRAERLFLNRDGKIVPTGNAQIRPVVDAALGRSVDQPPDGRGRARRPGRRADLIADHVDLLALAAST